MWACCQESTIRVRKYNFGDKEISTCHNHESLLRNSDKVWKLNFGETFYGIAAQFLKSDFKERRGDLVE